MQIREQWIDEAIKNIRKKMDWVSDKNKDIIPYTCAPKQKCQISGRSTLTAANTGGG